MRLDRGLAAFYALALDSGARKGELCGLTWAHLDLDAGKMRIVQQLLKPGAESGVRTDEDGAAAYGALAAETVVAAARRTGSTSAS